MPIRMTGMVSGLDTDAIVQELMAAQTAKKQKVVNKQTTLTWTQEIWKDLNTKLYKFYIGSLSKLKTQGQYKTKKVSSSNENVVTATAAIGAATGAHSLKIRALASSQYVTGGKVTVQDGTSSNATTNTKLTSLGMTEGTAITIKNGDKEEILTVDSSTTVKDFVNKCTSAGLTANFDAKQQRFFINSAKSGAESEFSITSGTAQRTGANTAIQNLIAGASTDDTIYSNYITEADTIQGKLKAWVDGAGDGETRTLSDAADELLNCVTDTTMSTVDRDAVLTKYGISTAEYDRFKDAYNAGIGVNSGYSGEETIVAFSNAMSNYLSGDITADELLQNFNANAAADDSIVSKAELTAAYNDLKTLSADAYEALSNLDLDTVGNYEDIDFGNNEITEEQFNSYKLLAGAVDKTTLDTQMKIYIADEIDEFDSTAGGTSELKKLGLGEIIPTGMTSADNITAANSSDMSIKWASDAEIELDGAILTDSSNTFTVNGLTLNLTATTWNDVTNKYDEVQLNVTNDVSAVYDMVKQFVNDYNELLKEMNEKYNAKSARGYDPLTDEQKEAMTDDEIEKWETKIKDSLLRRDNTLSSITSAMRTAMMSSVKIDGKTYSLSSLGIMTSSDYTEKGLLHIYGDEDDDTYSTETKKLKNMLEENPDVVMEILTKAANTLYDSFQKQMSRTSLSRALTFYNDIQMENQQRDYATEISKWDTKLKDMEDRYYSQFTAMEKALASIQSQSNYFASMLGTS